jgi:hypothetical protein
MIKRIFELELAELERKYRRASVRQLLCGIYRKHKYLTDGAFGLFAMNFTGGDPRYKQMIRESMLKEKIDYAINNPDKIEAMRNVMTIDDLVELVLKEEKNDSFVESDKTGIYVRIDQILGYHRQHPKAVTRDIQPVNEPDFLILVVSREQVESADITDVLDVLEKLLTSPEIALEFCERVDITFDGYNDDARELFEIPEVRNFVYELDNQFPFWLYFLSKYHSGLFCVLNCFLPPNLMDEAKKRKWPQLIQEYLLKRGIPALNQVCAFVGYSDKRVQELTDNALRYIQHGRFPLKT